MTQNPPPSNPKASLLSRLPWLLLAWSCALLGFIGLFFPVVPTVPFLLVAAWAASKGSPRLHQWLYTHPQFGPMLIAWHTRRAVPRHVKWLTPLLLTGSLGIMWLAGIALWIMAVCLIIFVTVTAYLWSRPDA